MFRRQILRAGLGAASFMTVGLLSFSALARTTASGRTFAEGAAIKLAQALRSIGCDECSESAMRLETSLRNDGSISLHARRAGLSAADAMTISDTLQSLTYEQASSLGSFSLSYNPLIGDEGALALARSLPDTLRELGLVGCEIKDTGDEAILRWASKSSYLRIICIEENQFSEHLKAQFRQLRQKNENLLVIV